MKMIRVLILLFLPLLIGGCVAETLQTSLLAQRIDPLRHVLSAMTVAYERKDEQAFLEFLDHSAISSSQIQERLREDFSVFSEIKIDLMMDHVQFSEQAAWVAVHWRGHWKTTTSESIMEKRGQALLRWSTDEPPKLREIRGSTPFGLHESGE